MFKRGEVFLLFFLFAGYAFSESNIAPPLVNVGVEIGKNDDIYFYGDNSYPIPCFVIVDLVELVNIREKPVTPFKILLPPNGKSIKLFVLKGETGKLYHYSYKYRFILGDPSSDCHDDSYPYLLPYEPGTKHLLSQGYNGKFSHRGLYALDFTMEIGTPVTAARGGIVVLVKDNSDKGGVNDLYKNEANYILIYHKDGSFGNYMHFRKKGIAVKQGDRVEPGELLGYSGNTGFSSRPHLHFDVSIPLYNGSRKTIAVKFLRDDGSLISLEEGSLYSSTRSGVSVR